MEVVGYVDGLEDAVGEDDPQSHCHLAVVKVHNHRVLAHMDLFPTLPTVCIAHLLIVDLYDIFPVVERKDDFLIRREECPFDTVVMQQVILLPAFSVMHLELRILFFLAQSD